ncbi:alpha/beta hydrolase [Vibrio sp. 99-8-1]|uniref:alpha/beta hydrolase n=1 Tax=Vibrio sp. 99-8-1 TaxID=2607602 RepID=UPI00149359F0|nr:alpha/beta hydrolase [Vibrio sp. 99-8-1]NOI65652.1 alpha/beta hydrolase [Vibrio sp. 99-8-1]
MKYITRLLMMSLFWSGFSSADSLYDQSRNRYIPVEVTYPAKDNLCTETTKCPVAFLSAGYGVPHNKYEFLSKQLTELGYLVIAIGHELPTDPPLSVKGDLFVTRSENWIRGAETLEFVRTELQSQYSRCDFNSLLLVGHSNGGDISSWLGNESKTYIKSIITLDHRRVPLPRSKEINILSIRGSDFPANKGVLPTQAENIAFGSCVVTIPNSKHNDMSDYGPTWLKQKIAEILKEYLTGKSCDKLFVE